MPAASFLAAEVTLCLLSLAALPPGALAGSRDDKAPKTIPFHAPPAELADALRDLAGSDTEKRRAAATELGRLAEAEPFLRQYDGGRLGRENPPAARAVGALHAERGRRNMERVPEWAKAGRYDLLVDVALHLPEPGHADEVGRLLFDFAEAIRPIPSKFGGPEGKHRLVSRMDQFLKEEKLQRFHRPDDVLKTDRSGHAYVRARACEASSRKRFYWFALTREKLAGTAELSNQWENCYLFHNGDITFEDIDCSLAVCDGDVTFSGTAIGGSWSTIIARGSIRSEAGLRFDSSTYYAGGDITAKGSDARVGLLLAGGKIDVPPRLGAEESKLRVEKAGVKGCPFPVRFFETADVGVEAALKGGAVRVTKLTPGSPLAKHDVKEGDAVTRVNDTDIKTVDDLRRELRYSVALEAGVFHITRDGEKTTRVVYFKNGLEK